MHRPALFAEERLPVEHLKRLQEHRLRRIIYYAYDHSPFYHRLMDGASLKPSDIRRLDDLNRLPFTTKEDLRLSYPYGMLSVEKRRVARIHTTSGTTGKPTLTFFSEEDLQVWSKLMARKLRMASIRKGDILFIFSSYGLSTGGFAWSQGAEELNVSAVPAGPGNNLKKLRLMLDLQPSVLIITPSYALHLAEVAKREGIDFKRDLKLRVSIHGAEPWSEETRRRIQQIYGTEAFDEYGLTELCGPGVAMECHLHDGLHVFADHFLVEVVDPKTGETLPPGEEGELVFTTLSKEAMPLLRYRTRDISTLKTASICDCGTTLPKIDRIRGRVDDAIFVKSVKVYQSQIEEVVMKTPHTTGNYQVIVDRVDFKDTLKVEVEVDESTSKNSKTILEEELYAALGLHVEVETLPPGSLAMREDVTPKLQRIIDRRVKD